MNPAELLRLKSDLKTFENDHPKFPAFVRYCGDRGLREGTVVEIVLRQPDGAATKANMRLNEHDVKTLQRLRKALYSDECQKKELPDGQLPAF